MNENSFSGPHLSAAFLCEKILIERDNVPTFVRVIDRFTIPTFEQLPPGVQIPQPTIQVTLAISLKAGSIGGGKYKIRVIMQKPDGTRLPENSIQVFFSGSDDNGVLTGVPIMLVSPGEGLYWFDVFFEESLLTRIPMRVLFQPAVLPYQPPPSGPQ